MTLQEALDQADELKPNMMSRRLKIKYLTEIEQLIWNEIILKHYPEGYVPPRPYYPDLDPLNMGPAYPEPTPDMTPEPAYTEQTDPGTVLQIPDPYSEVYVFWLMSKIDIQNQEDGRYNIDRAHFENAYQTMSDWYNRTHMPKSYNREIRI